MRIQQGRAINSAKLCKYKHVNYKDYILCEMCTFNYVTCVPVNNVFPPDVRDPLLESGPTQQRPVSAACPVLHAFVNDVPTQSAWEDIEIISGDAYEFDEDIAEYCRATHKNAYNILDAL